MLIHFRSSLQRKLYVFDSSGKTRKKRRLRKYFISFLLPEKKVDFNMLNIANNVKKRTSIHLKIVSQIYIREIIVYDG
jgi:hypothetical protein